MAWLHRQYLQSHPHPVPSHPSHVVHSRMQLHWASPITAQVSMHVRFDPFPWHCPNRHGEPTGSGSAFGQVSFTPLTTAKDTPYHTSGYSTLCCSPTLCHYLLPRPPCTHPSASPPLHTPLQVGILAQRVRFAANAVGPPTQGPAGGWLAPSTAHFVAVTAGCLWQQHAGSGIAALVPPAADVKAKVALLPVPHYAIATELQRCS